MRFPESSIYQWDAEVFGWKGASVETKDIRDVALDLRGHIKEEDLGFILVTVQT